MDPLAAPARASVGTLDHQMAVPEWHAGLLAKMRPYWDGSALGLCQAERLLEPVPAAQYRFQGTVTLSRRVSAAGSIREHLSGVLGSFAARFGFAIGAKVALDPDSFLVFHDDAVSMGEGTLEPTDFLRQYLHGSTADCIYVADSMAIHSRYVQSHPLLIIKSLASQSRGRPGMWACAATLGYDWPNAQRVTISDENKVTQRLTVTKNLRPEVIWGLTHINAMQSA
jgi:hypothetical protein